MVNGRQKGASFERTICNALQDDLNVKAAKRDLEQYRMIAFGGAMVLIMVFKPKGILANRKPTILMHGDKK